MAAIPFKAPKPKMTERAVQGKILVMSEDGERIGQWGGTECFLSWQTTLGPCLVVRSSKHRKHEGSFFQLVHLRRVLDAHTTQGKLTVVVPHQKRVCHIFIETQTDIEELKAIAALLTAPDRMRQWKLNMERNVASKKAAARRGRGGGATNGLGGIDGHLRDPAVGLENDGMDNFSEEDELYGDAPIPADGEQQQQQQSATAEKAAAATPSRASLHSTPSAAREASLEALRRSRNWSDEQLRALKYVQRGDNVFVTGSAGTGKTEWLLYVLHEVLLPQVDPHYVRGKGINHNHSSVAVTATTGVAARLLGGCTVHAFAGIGRGEGTTEQLLERVEARKDVVAGWQNCSVLIIDEVGMLPAHVFTRLDAVARHVRRDLYIPDSTGGGGGSGSLCKDLPFGGIQLIVVGDFLQLPPVARGDEEAQAAFASPAWAACHFKSVELKRNFRFQPNIPFLTNAYARLEEAGEGNSAATAPLVHDTELFAQCCEDVRHGRYTLLVDTVLSACLHRPLDTREMEATVILSRRKDVDKYNQRKLKELDTVEFVRYVSEDYAMYPGEQMDKDLSLPEVLTLKVGAQVVLLASLPECAAVSNGSLGVVQSFVPQARGPALPLVRFHCGVEVCVGQAKVEVLDRDGRVRLSRQQVPLQLAWALTVHRVQGMTLDMAQVQLDQSFFEAGQAYVALSRVRCAEDLSLTALEPEAVRAASPAVLAFYSKLFPQTEAQRQAAQARAEEEKVLLEARWAERRKQHKRGTAAAGTRGGGGSSSKDSGKRPRETKTDDKEANSAHKIVSLDVNTPHATVAKSTTTTASSLQTPERPAAVSAPWAVPPTQDETESCDGSVPPQQPFGMYVSENIAMLTQESDSFQISLHK